MKGFLNYNSFKFQSKLLSGNVQVVEVAIGRKKMTEFNKKNN